MTAPWESDGDTRVKVAKRPKRKPPEYDYEYEEEASNDLAARLFSLLAVVVMAVVIGLVWLAKWGYEQIFS